MFKERLFREHWNISKFYTEFPADIKILAREVNLFDRYISFIKKLFMSEV
jgi:hypothetical protein